MKVLATLRDPNKSADSAVLAELDSVHQMTPLLLTSLCGPGTGLRFRWGDATEPGEEEVHPGTVGLTQLIKPGQKNWKVLPPEKPGALSLGLNYETAITCASGPTHYIPLQARSVLLPQNEQFYVTDSMWVNMGDVRPSTFAAIPRGLNFPTFLKSLGHWGG